ncbi:hypothetical protein [Nonomuraea aridisoli]|nr:hypothetical protein [Nonomuraea aridisoli]
MNSRLSRDAFRDPLVEDEVPYAVLAPDGHGEGLPLILVLHGADSSSDFLAMLRPIAEALWDDGTLPPSLLACASTPTAGGFYIDRPGNAWESLIARRSPPSGPR